MTEVKALGEGKIGGYGVVFTGPEAKDLQGDYFTPDTNLWLDSYPVVPLLYQHGQDETLKRRVIGQASGRLDDRGAWYEAQLNLRDEYEQLILKLVEAGQLGYSTGSLTHLVERSGDGKLLNWPVAELTLTPTPAAGPYLTSVEKLKACYKSAGISLKKGVFEMADELLIKGEFEATATMQAAQPPEQAAQSEVEQPPEQKNIDQVIESKLAEALKPYLVAQPRSGVAI